MVPAIVPVDPLDLGQRDTAGDAGSAKAPELNSNRADKKRRDAPGHNVEGWNIHQYGREGGGWSTSTQGRPPSPSASSSAPFGGKHPHVLRRCGASMSAAMPWSRRTRAPSVARDDRHCRLA